MKIYVGHSRNFDFENELYKPIKESNIYKEHTVIFPHEGSDEFSSKEILKECDVMIAEVSCPSTGLGIEMGWANVYGCLIIGVYKQGKEISSSLKEVCSHILEYSNNEELISNIEKFI